MCYCMFFSDISRLLLPDHGNQYGVARDGSYMRDHHIPRQTIHQPKSQGKNQDAVSNRTTSGELMSSEGQTLSI